MSIAARLDALGITLPPVAAALASYVPAVRHGDLIFTAGQLPMVNGQLPVTGLVDDGVRPEDAAGLARTCALNGIAAAADVAGGVDRLARVIKVVGFVASGPEFTGQPAVINGASQVLQEIFGDAGIHARSAVGVAALPLGAPVEIEFVFAV